jgi:hypothetical protein
MRATALLPISLLALGCARVENVPLTAKLVMSNAPADWCGSLNPDTIRMDCAFQLGIYFSDDASKKVLGTTCVKLEGKMGRTWKDLPQELDTAMVATHVDLMGTQAARLEVAVIEPPDATNCDHSTALITAAFYGKSDPVTPDDDTLKRIDVPTKCVRSFSATSSCLP